MHCSACGYENDEESKFCSKCGNPFIQSQDYSQNEKALTSYSAPPTVNGKKAWKTIAVGISISVLLIAGVLWLSKSNPDFEKGLAAAKNNDYVGALKEWEPIAEQGDPNTQFNVGLIYFNGTGVPKDESKAAYWFTKAAENDLPQAQYNIGLMYFKGMGVARDQQKAVYWLKKAIDNGNEDAIRFANIFGQ